MAGTEREEHEAAVAYEAYRNVAEKITGKPHLSWERLEPDLQCAWRAASQAGVAARLSRIATELSKVLELRGEDPTKLIVLKSE